MEVEDWKKEKWKKKKKKRKAAGLAKISLKFSKSRKFDDIHLIMQDSLSLKTIDKLIKVWIVPFNKKCDPEIITEV